MKFFSHIYKLINFRSFFVEMLTIILHFYSLTYCLLAVYAFFPHVMFVVKEGCKVLSPSNCEHDDDMVLQKNIKKKFHQLGETASVYYF